MTVLSKYQRLEAEGVWRPEPEAQRRDVVVSIGKATLVITGSRDEVLQHWSLPALRRMNPGQRPAVFTPGEDATETLEIADAEMIEAINRVLKALRRGRARPGRLRAGLTLSVIGLFAIVATLWLPGAINRYTAGLVPDGARSAIGRDIASELRRVAGTPCAAPSGRRALDLLQARLFPDGDRTLSVLPSGLTESAHHAGGTLLLSHRLVEDLETPEALAGYILAEDIRSRSRDPLRTLLDDAGLRAAIVLLTTGRLPEGALRAHVEALVTRTPAEVSDEALLDRLDRAGISATPYAFARDISGETTVALIEASQPAPNADPLLSDGNWIALQRICEPG